jgi:transcriptional regulator with XRE-family HTH domain
MATWLKTIRALNRMKQEELAQVAGVSRSTISYYENGGPVPQEVADRIRAQVAVIPAMADTPLRNSSATMDVGRVSRIISRGYVLLPVAPSPLAGSWMSPNLNDCEGIEVDAKFGGDGRFVSHMEGDCMLPYLEPDDLLVWQESSRPKLNRIVYARNGAGEITVKQLKHDGQEFILSPLNDRYENATAATWEADAFLVGVVRVGAGTEVTLYSPDGLIPNV